MNTFDAWVTIVNQANDEIKHLRAFNERMMQVLESYIFLAKGGGAAGAHRSVNRMAEEIIKEYKEQS